VLAVDLATLVALGWCRDGVIEFVSQVGDFLAAGEPPFVLYGGAMAIDDRTVRSAVVFGPERTLEHKLRLLDRAIERRFREPGELALARIPDSHGLGGSSGARLTSPG